jgi:hypothetical protein
MQNDHLQRVLLDKAKHLTQKDAERLYTLAQDADERTLMRLASVSTASPLLLTLLFWLLPPFFLFNNFFLRNYLIAIIQLLMVLMIFPSMSAWVLNDKHVLMQAGEIPFDQAQLDYANTLKVFTFTNALMISTWYFFDGITIYWRTKSANFSKLKKVLK